MELFDELRQSRILIADASYNHRQRLTNILQEAGFQQVEAVAGDNELAARLRTGLLEPRQMIDLLLLEQRLPEQGAEGVMLQLNQRDAWAAIVTMLLVEQAGDWDAETLRAGMRLGAVDVISKPFRQSDLVPRVLLALTLKREREQRLTQACSLETELAERKVMEARLQYIAAHDELTGLANRRRLEQVLDLTRLRCRSFRRTAGVLYLDLDKFKLINDIEGHEYGDRMLIMVAKLLRRELSTAQLIARIGADEYCAVIEDTTLEQLETLAERLLQGFEELELQGMRSHYQVSASIGLALIEPEADAGNVVGGAILARADQACQVAKARGGRSLHAFSQGDGELEAVQRDLELVPRIRQALTKDGFMLVFQPIVRVADSRISHYEALLRMQGDGERIYSPDEFIPLAERMGLIQQIDHWVVDKAIDVLASLPAEQEPVKLSINLSARGLQDATLVELVRKKLDICWVQPSRLMFEITETVAISNISATRDMVARLRAMGCTFALDDFGTGFSSFSYVKSLPVDYLKIDGSFVINLIDDPMDQVLVRSIVDVGRTLGKKVVAEYVDNEKVLALLRHFGVDYVQGYHLGKPSLAPLPLADYAAPPAHSWETAHLLN